ncbi:Myb-like transcription factor family protein [Quillaja saponaria]|uniref:Myb-like transcription factor family protein n=1 Tax=Quillaja saponaria TaxID=32244 RepID=A0AAD7KRB4_QUISA|nr:Myb-like transcription factor family protein [Quillaja saponaria]
MELSLDLNLAFVPKTISELLCEVSKIRDVSVRFSKLDDFVKRLEDEMRKIDAFKRELPLCMILINDAILRLKEEIVLCKEIQDPPVIEEFIPLKKDSREENGLDMGDDCSDKKNWMSSAQLWSSDNKLRSEEDDRSLPENPNQPWNQKNRGKVFLPFNGNSGFSKMALKEDKEVSQVASLSLMTPASESKSSSRGSSGSSLLTDPIKIQGQPQEQQLQQNSRKQRRCWSPELHRRFVDALQQLGGVQVATPKQIRELMQVGGLTNDEVKSHLQKYRLHVRRLPASSVAPSNGFWVAKDKCGEKSNLNFPQSGSPQGPLVGGSAKGLSSIGGTGMDAEEDEKSDGHNWKGGFITN